MMLFNRGVFSSLKSFSKSSFWARYVALLFLFVIAFGVVNAQNVVGDLKTQVDSFERQLTRIEQDIDARSVDGTEQAVLIEQLRILREQALKFASVQQAELQKLQDQASALGSVDADTSLAEDEALAEQRAGLNDKISQIDALIKKSQFVALKAKTEADDLASQAYDQKRDLLLKRDKPLYNSSSYKFFFNEAVQWFSQFSNWGVFGFLVLCSFAYAGGMAFFLPRVNRYIDQKQSLNARPMSQRLVVVTGLVLSAVIVLRTGFIDAIRYPNFFQMLLGWSSVVVAVLSYGLYAHIKFVSVRVVNEDTGQIKKNNAWLWNGLLGGVKLLLVVSVLLAFAGYVQLGSYLAQNLTLTLVLVFGFIGMRHGSVHLIRLLTRDGKDLLRHAGGISSSQDGAPAKSDISPFAVMLLEPVIAGFCLVVGLYFWGFQPIQFVQTLSQYQNGIPIGSVTIKPLDILTGLGAFVVLYSITKAIQWFVSERVFPRTTMDHGLQDAIYHILGYVGIIIAVISGLSILGVKMANLALVAGALSVGIGFGLQAIVSNFISGLIMLFERPVKVGDWVVVGGHEGKVRRIRVRSTEIETFQRASVLVPNSQFISDSVTNWNFNNPIGRVEVAVGVAYGTNTQDVARILLDVATRHGDVRTRPAPQVLFVNFGASSLDFELRCFIRDVNDRLRVSSDLRFMIDLAFRDAGIEIPYSKLDLNVLNPTFEIKSDRSG